MNHATQQAPLASAPDIALNNNRAAQGAGRRTLSQREQHSQQLARTPAQSLREQRSQQLAKVPARHSSSLENVVTQTAQVLPGIASGVVNIAASPFTISEAKVRENAAREQWAGGGGARFNSPQDVDNALGQGAISQQEADVVRDIWGRSGGSPVEQAIARGDIAHTGDSPITGAVNQAQEGIRSWAGKWIPSPENGAAQLVSEAAYAAGQAVPGMAASLATGGSALWGNLAGWTVNALGSMSQGVANGESLGGAALGAALDIAAEAAVGKLGEGLTKGIANKGVQWAANAIGEGLEEVAAGAVYAALTGGSYTLGEAAHEFAVGALAGGALGSLADAVAPKIMTALIQADVNTPAKRAAGNDVRDVKALVRNADASATDAVIAHDSAQALSRQLGEGAIDPIRQTTEIPKSTAERFHLSDAKAGDTPISITQKTYEHYATRLVDKIRAPEITDQVRAQASPASTSSENPRALYKYAEGIYLRPGTDTDASRNLFTYRGQDSMFYRSSVQDGIPASGAGTSWEGVGVYSARTPYTTDLYGPTGKLPDNPYSNKGIPHINVKSNEAQGIILSQKQGLNEIAKPQRMSDVEGDIVPQGERRIRYDDKGRGRITEVVNNPADVSVVGLVFGRQGMEGASPIQYAGESTGIERPGIEHRAAGTSPAANTVPAMGTVLAAEVETGRYALPSFNWQSLHINAGGENAKEGNANAQNTQEKNPGGEYIAGREPVPASHTAAGEMQAGPSENPAGSGARALLPEATERDATYTRKNQTDAYSPKAFTEVQNSNGNSAQTPASRLSPSNTVQGGQNTFSPSRGRQNGNYSRSEKIWSPTPAQTGYKNQKTSGQDRERKKKWDERTGGVENLLYRGPGSTGRVFESSSYAATFGGLSSY